MKKTFKERQIFLLIILISSLILAGSYFGVQYMKQKSIEYQKKIDLEIKQKEIDFKEKELEEDRWQQETKNDLEELKVKQAECEALSVGIMKKWSNILGVSYDNDLWEECIVTYVDPKTEKVITNPLSVMTSLDNNYNYFRVNIKQDKDCNIKKIVTVDSEIINVPSQDYEKFITLSFSSGRDLLYMYCPKGYYMTECSEEFDSDLNNCLVERYSYNELNDAFFCEEMNIYISCKRN